ncbi:MAG: HAD family phosphatase [Firmicutes bacterium]|nr:HAD family phosphatase [Bacillota bacterium]
MFNNIKGVIFDLDGTIVDSMWIWKQIDIEYLETKGYSLPKDLQKDIEGMSFTETANYFKNRFKLEDEIDEIKEEWNLMALDFYKNRIKLKKGAKDFLKLLKGKNIKLGIATSNSKRLATAVLDSNKIYHYFDTIRTSCEVNKGKPNPDVFLKAAEDLDISPEECLAFEDTYAGVLAAKRAGMKVIAIADNLSLPYKKEIKHLADEYIEDYFNIA